MLKSAPNKAAHKHLLKFVKSIY